jgi:membrane-associated phospholipid phosphatase
MSKTNKKRGKVDDFDSEINTTEDEGGDISNNAQTKGPQVHAKEDKEGGDIKTNPTRYQQFKSGFHHYYENIDERQKALNLGASVDKNLSLWFYELASNNTYYFNDLVTYGGLVSYELYVLPGMMMAIMYAAAKNESQSLRFHVLPHVFAFSMVGLIKHAAERPRPGCQYNEMNPELPPRPPGPVQLKAKAKESYGKPFVEAKAEEESYLKPFESRHKCKGGFRDLSFPSGHSCVAFSVATGLMMYMFDTDELKWSGSKDSNFAVYAGCALAGLYCLSIVIWHIKQMTKNPFRILTQLCIGIAVCTLFFTIGYFDYNTAVVQNAVVCLAYTVAVLTALHRIAKGYHHVSDSVVGALLGAACGVFVYTMLGKRPDRTIFTWDLFSTSLAPMMASQAIVFLIGSWYIWYFFSFTTRCYAADIKKKNGDVEEGGCALAPLYTVEH